MTGKKGLEETKGNKISTQNVILHNDKNIVENTMTMNPEVAIETVNIVGIEIVVEQTVPVVMSRKMIGMMVETIIEIAIGIAIEITVGIAMEITVEIAMEITMEITTEITMEIDHKKLTEEKTEIKKNRNDWNNEVKH